jgi:cytochrome b involved in lipid metabolism
MSNIINSKDLPPPIKRRRYYTPEEVKCHNTANNCWVVIFHEVFDLTELIQKNYSILTDPIVKEAGNDISHWFDAITRDVSKKYIIY